VKSDKTDVKRVVLFARWVSWIGHPLVFISLTVGIIIALRLANRAGLGLLLTLLATVILPMALLLFRGSQSGRWSDPDVSIHAERIRFPRIAVPVLSSVIACAGAYWFIERIAA
jgi:hypothetical protein